MIRNGKVINDCFNLSAQRLMVKTTQKSDLPWSAIFSLIVYNDSAVAILLFYSILVSNFMMKSKGKLKKLFQMKKREKAHQVPKLIMSDRFPWQQGVSKVCKGNNIVLVPNCHRSFPNMIFEIKLIFVTSIQQFVSLEVI